MLNCYINGAIGVQPEAVDLLAGTHIFQYGLDYIFTLLQYRYINYYYCKIGAGHFPRRLRGTDLITMDNRVGRSFILVVEPSSQFLDRCLAADCPIPSFFQTFTLTVSSHVVVRRALRSSSNSPSYTLIRYQIRRPSFLTEGVEVLPAAGNSIEPSLLAQLG